MNNTAKPLHFFLGANTPQGFVSRFDQLADRQAGWREFVIKGGPGTGKSTLMRRIAEKAQGRCQGIELIHCSSDVDSLDGVILQDVKTSIADGTSPHVIEPKFPGAFEQLVDLSSCWDQEQLFQDRGEIIPLTERISRRHEHCCRLLGAAGSLLSDSYRIALEATDVEKAVRAAGRIARLEFRRGPQTKGRESVRFLSCVSNKGQVFFHETVQTLCDRVYLLEDLYGASSRLILKALRAAALEAGWDVISCYCPLSPYEKLEHLMIPDLRLGFFTANDAHRPNVAVQRVVRSRRFTDPDQLRRNKKRLTFNRKASAQLLDSAGQLLGEAKQLHDQLEGFYVRAMDFGLAGQVFDRTLDHYERILKEHSL